MSDQMPVITRIVSVVQETPTVRTIRFDHQFDSAPGQFVMVWVPGVDEIPMALSAHDAITVQEVGDATRIIGESRPGDKIGIRGPFGNGFSVAGRVMAVAGGVGVAPLIPLARQNTAVTFLLGSRTAAELLYTEELGSCSDLRIATDDGSAGYHGYIAGLLREQELDRYDTICVCGPELMMKSVLDVLEENEIAHIGQFSLHRYMKCGVGLCGSCCVDPEGLCVCRDGPVFRGDILINSELGRYHRDASGRKE
jgi:dihydroorotate dehydrogenase electron transfer subunit